MPTTFCSPIDNMTPGPTLGSAYTAGSGSMTLAATFGAAIAAKLAALGLPPVGTYNPPTTAPLRFTVIKASAVNSSGFITDMSGVTIFTATGLNTSTNVLSGVVNDSSTADQNFASADLVRVFLTARDIAEIHAAIHALEVTAAGLGTASTHAATDFLATANNLSDVASASTARTNLGLGSASTHPASDFVTTPLPQFANTVTGLVPIPSPAGGSAKFLREDATWQVPAGGGGGGVSSVGLTIGLSAPWLSQSGSTSPITSSGSFTISATGGQTANQVLASPNGSSGALAVRALVPADLISGSGGGTSNFLRADGTWATPAGGGGGGSPGGADTQIQYNSSGAFAGSANLTYASGILKVTSGQISCLGTGTGEHFGSGSSAADQGVAIGHGATSGAIGATSIGYNTNISGVNAVGIGSSVSVSGDSGVCIGVASTSVGLGLALGSFSSCSGVGGTACGTSSIASGTNSTAFGNGAIASAIYSTSLGTAAHSAYDNSISLGFGSASTRASQLMIGSLYNAVDEIVFGTLNPRIYLQGYDSTVVLQNIGKISSGYSNNTHSSFTTFTDISGCDWTGVDRPGIRCSSDGTQALVGFFGVTPVARQTGGAATAGSTYTSAEQTMLNAVYTALRNLGLIT